MSRYKFILPFFPLLLGILSLIFLPSLIKPEVVLSFRLGLGAVLFGFGLLITLWMQSLGVVDSLREKKMRTEMEALTRSYEDSHRRFIRRLDHELKNPLMGLQASLENLQAVTELEERRKAEGNIQKALERLVRLLRDLRKLSDLDESKLERESVDIPELVEEIIEVLRSTPGREHRRINLMVTRVPTPPPPVSGDRDLLGISLYNLLDNALKFTVQNEAVEVRVRDDERVVFVEVADGGSGIHPDEQQKVFEELYRGENAHAVEGSGLGLSFVKRIVALHHGELTLRSQRDEQHGSIFTIRLPVTKL
ncbi:MAG TPA: HAMP domain-containing sensor histidine kinase [Anaerolineales bacterium]|nr:HAMP domain-containing sensor histidine kinase [Anaerolineales bacterium]HMZ44261.1 HAMP domain-containing sensor histidine kinase [Anaerolineales bacterium]HNB88583.1 HAMP domain-containing sensor histidine kinase [Anaerolineales bacterium]HNE70380.1 HAMP domain-containing sensor histidine kinase [Anaerolineales bacterium]HNH80671.1 HAMP domain-containing sensor histidine kinase [Anaerolineales bacterium]